MQPPSNRVPRLVCPRCASCAQNGPNLRSPANTHGLNVLVASAIQERGFKGRQRLDSDGMATSARQRSTARSSASHFSSDAKGQPNGGSLVVLRGAKFREHENESYAHTWAQVHYECFTRGRS